MSKHNDVATIEHAKGGNGGGLKRHCARRWWLYVIGFILVALALVLGLIFGILPKIAQKTINESTITVQGVSITKPENDKFIYGQNSTVKGHVPVKAHLNPMSIAMFIPPPEGQDPKPFMYLNTSRQQLSDEFHIDVANYEMKITDKEAFLEFTKQVLGKEKVTLALKARPELVTGALHNYVDYNKQVELNGFNGLKGVSLYNSTVLKEPEADGTNLISYIYIPNKSDFTMEVGDLTCNFASPGLGALGYGVVPNLVLNRGDNRAIVRGVLKPEIYNNTGLTAVIPLGGLTVTVSGNSTIYNGQHISWLEAPLNELPLEVPILKKGEFP